MGTWGNNPWGNTPWGGGGTGGGGGGFTQTAGQPQTAHITTSTPVLWSNGNLYNGWLMLGVAMPTGASGNSYPSITLWGNMPPQPLPQWIMIPIVQGQIDQNTSVFQSPYLDPPGCRYVAYWLDTNKNVIYPTSGTAPSLFDITTGSYVIQQPFLAIPATPNIIPAPQKPGMVSPNSSGEVFSTPTYEIPGGVVDGTNTVFTVSRVPSFLMFFIDGQLQAPGTYAVTGNIVSLSIPPTVGATLTAMLV